MALGPKRMGLFKVMLLPNNNAVNQGLTAYQTGIFLRDSCAVRAA
jgi:hypothetical protein